MILYSNNCPRCNILKSKLISKNIDFDIVDDLCYMISILQQLFYSPFSTRLLQTNWNNEMKIYSSEYFMLTSLQACFSALNKKNGISIDLKEWLKYYHSPANEEININQQEDSHEFLMNFFDQMNSVLANTSDPSIIEDLFVSTMKVSIECSICHGVSSHLEVLNCISLGSTG